MRKKICGIAAVVLIFTLSVLSVTEYCLSCRNIREGVLRLHITANSDDEADQDVKLKVRDALLQSGSGIFDGSLTAEDAAQKLEPELNKMEQIANKVLGENGFDYTARAYIVKEYFDTRTYGDITLPAGNYTALRVALGTGTGHNWWCVMFPPLCLPAVTQSDDTVFDVFTGENEKAVKPEGGYKVRFKLAEDLQKLIEKFKNK